jgi:hypothetical protein
MADSAKETWGSGDAYEQYVGCWSRPVAREFLEWLNVEPGLRWGDVGCGTGALVECILAGSDPTSIIAVDRALFHQPPLIFLDEPTAGFDPVAAAALHADLTSLVTREGVTVFLNTHNLAEAEKLCAQVGVVRNGKLITIGNPDELRLSKGGLKVGPLVTLIVQSDGEVEEIRRTGTRLEDLFLTLMKEENK